MEERSRVGDWEVDTVIGHLGGSLLVTMVKWKSRCTLIALVDRKDSAVVTAGMLHSLRPCRDKVETMTFDHGTEFGRHTRRAEQLEAMPTSRIPILPGNVASTATPTV